MSNNKLIKFLQRPLKHPYPRTRGRTPVILSDSKGRYLEDQVVTHYETEIVWLYKSGATITEGRIWLEKNLHQIIQQYGNISLYLWFGTCTLTRKIPQTRGCIQLTSYSEDPIHEITDEIQRIASLIQPYTGSKLTVLEVPIYSIERWNQPEDKQNIQPL